MRTIETGIVSVLALTVIVLAGCGSSPPPKAAPPAAQSNAPPPPPAPTQPPVISAPALGSPAANTSSAPPAANPPVVAQPAPATSPTPPDAHRVNIAEAGKKDFGGPAIVKPITVPVQTLFSVRARTKWIEIEHALNLYKAEHEKGPQSEKEFFDNVIKANQIDLPKLQPGERYVFDVQQQQLLVEQPGK